MKKRRLKDQVKSTCRMLRCGVEDLFVRAFLHTLGKRRGVRRQATLAAQRFKSGRELYQRARDIIAAFISSITQESVTASS